MQRPNIDDNILEKYIHSFYGYGNPNGPYWFIGKEEGGDLSLAQNLGRVTAWNERGEMEFDDLFGFHESIGVLECFGEKAKLQPTWNKLIRILLSAQGDEPNAETVREYQGTSLARKDSETCLPELLPLPARSTSEWDYSEVSYLPYLRSREIYRNEIGPKRALHLKDKVNFYKPKLVVFYSMDRWYREQWKIISDCEFEEVDGTLVSKTPDTVFAILPHPTAFGYTNKYFHEAGALFRKMLGE